MSDKGSLKITIFILKKLELYRRRLFQKIVTAQAKENGENTSGL